MSSRFVRRTLPGIGIALVLLAGGVVVGRVLASDDESAAAAPVVATEIAGPTVRIPVVEPVALGDAPPPEPAADDPTLGLGAIVGDLSVPAAELTVQDVVVEPPPPPAAVDLAAALAPPPGGWAEPVVLDDGLGTGGVVPIEVALDLADLEPTVLDVADLTVPDVELTDVEPTLGTPVTDPVTEPSTRPVGEEEAAPGLRAIDPCAPVDGTPPPDDCPDGLRSTVLALTSPPELWTSGAQARSIPPELRSASCDPGEVADDQLLLRLTANAPGTFTVTISSMPAREPITTTTVATAAPDRDAWNAHLAAATVSEPRDPRYAIAHCVVIDGLPVGEQVHWLASFLGDFGWGGLAAGYERVGPDPVRPPTIVVPVSSAQVFVSVPHREDQYVDIRAWLGDGSSECRSGSRSLYTSVPSTTSVTAERLRARGHIDTYTRRTWMLVTVPESAAGVICMRTYDTRGPSFVTERPLLTEVALVHAPDLVVPVVTVETVGVLASVGEAAVVVGLRRARGYGCGGYRGELTGEGTLQEMANTPCDSLDHWDANEVTKPIVVTTSLRRTGADEVTTSAAIGGRARRCTGGDPATGVPGSCPHPPAQWFRIPFGTVSVSAGLCSPGLFESTCEPPRRDTVAGTAVVRVDWQQGATSGRSGWLVEPIDATPRSTELAELPQLDDADVLRIVGPDTDPVISGTLTADRPVEWSVELPGAVCQRDDGPRTFAGGAPSPTFRLEIAGLCPGQEVGLIATITDPATGRSTVWGRPDLPTGRVWRYGYVSVPPPTRSVIVTLGASPPGDWIYAATALDLRVRWRPDGTGWSFDFPTPLTRDPRYMCSVTYRRYVELQGTSREAFVSLPIPDRIYLDVTVSFREASGSTDNCRADGRNERTVRFTAEVTFEELTRPEGVRIPSPPGSAFPVVLVIQPAG